MVGLWQCHSQDPGGKGNPGELTVDDVAKDFSEVWVLQAAEGWVETAVQPQENAKICRHLAIPLRVREKTCRAIDKNKRHDADVECTDDCEQVLGDDDVNPSAMYDGWTLSVRGEALEVLPDVPEDEDIAEAGGKERQCEEGKNCPLVDVVMLMGGVPGTELQVGVVPKLPVSNQLRNDDEPCQVSARSKQP